MTEVEAGVLESGRRLDEGGDERRRQAADFGGGSGGKGAS